MSRSTEILVIGGGIIGLPSAFWLASHGREVMLVDRDRTGEAASVGNAGVLATDHVFPLASLATLKGALPELLKRDAVLAIRLGHLPGLLPWLARFILASRPSRFQRGVAALSALQASSLGDISALAMEAGLTDMIAAGGNLMIAETDRTANALQGDLVELHKHGVDAVEVDQDFVAAKAAAVTAPVAAAIWYRGTGHVSDPAELCKGYEAAFERAGGQLCRGDVISVEPDLSGYRVCLGSGELVAARKVIIAAGAWSGKLAGQLGYKVPLDVERGYHITATGLQVDLQMSVASKDRTTYLTQMSSGLRMTTGVELGGMKLPPNPRFHDMLERHLGQMVASAHGHPVSRWMGFRPSLSDHLPVIGGCKRHKGLYFAFGHQHLGLTLSGVTARLLGEAILGNDPPEALLPFSIDRFG